MTNITSVTSAETKASTAPWHILHVFGAHPQHAVAIQRRKIREVQGYFSAIVPIPYEECARLVFAITARTRKAGREVPDRFGKTRAPLSGLVRVSGFIIDPFFPSLPVFALYCG